MTKNKQDLAKSYIIQGISVACVVTLLVMLIGEEVLGLGYDVLGAPVMVSASFIVVTTIIIALLWKWIATNHQDFLVTFFTSVSGFRMLLALAVITTCYFVVGRDGITPYIVVFMLYYFAGLAQHSIFFSRINN